MLQVPGHPFPRITPVLTWEFVRNKAVLLFSGLYILVNSKVSFKIRTFSLQGLQDFFASRFRKASLELRVTVVYLSHGVLRQKRKGGLPLTITGFERRTDEGYAS
jgi:hypothetical protein